MKKLPCLAAACIAFTSLSFVSAQETESDPKSSETVREPKVSLGESVTSTDTVPPKAVARTNSDQLEERIKGLETRLDRLFEQLDQIEKVLVRKDDLDQVETRLQKTVASKPEKPTPDKTMEELLTALNVTVGDLQSEIGRIQQRLGMKTIGPYTPPEGQAKETNLVDDLPKAAPVEREAFIVIRNRTGDPQTFLVDGQEWRVPAGGEWYDIPVTLIGNQSSVMGQVYPHDRAKRREFRPNNGRLESRVDITLQLAQ